MYYWFYIFICWVTRPIRFILNFFGYSDLSFAIRLLFYNDYCYDYVYNQAMLESGRGKSQLTEKYHNFFGMGFTKNSPYQRGAADIHKVGEPTFATYDSVYQSVYDYYDLVNRRKKALWKDGLSRVPKKPFVRQSDEHFNYVAWVSGVYSGNGYFDLAAGEYAVRIWEIGYDSKSYILPFWISISYIPLSFILAFVLVRKFFREFKNKKNVKKPQTTKT